MKLDDKRKLTSHLNALKSTGPNTRTAHRPPPSTPPPTEPTPAPASAPAKASSITVEAHFHQYNPNNLIARCLASQMATTLAPQPHRPCRSYILRIQLDRMEPAIRIEFDDIPAAGLYALGVSALENQGTAQVSSLVK